MRPLEHDRQAVDGDAGREHVVARRHDQRAGIIGAVARHVDHPAQAAIAAMVEQRLGESEPAGNRGARGAPVRRGGDLGGDAVRRLRAFDQPPRHDDLLVELAGPLEIGDGDLAVGALAQRAHEFARGQRLDVALALQRLLLRVHREGNVDRDHQFDVDRNGARAFVGEAQIRRGGGRERQAGGRHDAGDGTIKTASPHGERLAQGWGKKKAVGLSLPAARSPRSRCRNRRGRHKCACWRRAAGSRKCRCP